MVWAFPDLRLVNEWRMWQVGRSLRKCKARAQELAGTSEANVCSGSRCEGHDKQDVDIVAARVLE